MLQRPVDIFPGARVVYQYHPRDRNPAKDIERHQAFSCRLWRIVWHLRLDEGPFYQQIVFTERAEEHLPEINLENNSQTQCSRLSTISTCRQSRSEGAAVRTTIAIRQTPKRNCAAGWARVQAMKSEPLRESEECEKKYLNRALL